MFTPSFISSLRSLRTTNYAEVTVAELLCQIQAYNQEQFTGFLEVKIENTPDQQWSLHFWRGGLIWGTSQMHPIRCWYRQLSRHCPQLLAGQKSNSLHLPDYDVLTELVKQRTIRQDQLEAVVEDLFLEILFDIFQWGEKLCYRARGQLKYRKVVVDATDPKLIAVPAVIPCERAWRNALKLWEAWQRAGLEDCAPDLAPAILNAEKLQEQTSSIVYRNLTSLADGNQSFRDLAVKMNRNLLPLTQTIMPCIRQGLIGLRRVEDFRAIFKTVTATTPSVGRRNSWRAADMLTTYRPDRLSPQANASLVVCIDDSPIDSQAMSAILTEAGYRCININDPVQALPILIEKKPDLIFLDLVMPIANGYEVCAQIRRISMFKDTPVIILTSNDGIVDRVRAKMVGSSGFLSKPINSHKVLNMLRMHLHKSASASEPPSSNNNQDANLANQMTNNQLGSAMPSRTYP